MRITTIDEQKVSGTDERYIVGDQRAVYGLHIEMFYAFFLPVD